MLKKIKIKTTTKLSESKFKDIELFLLFCLGIKYCLRLLTVAEYEPYTEYSEKYL